MQRIQIYTAPWREKWRHFACPFGALTSEVEFRRSAKRPDSWGFQDSNTFFYLQNSTSSSKCSELAFKANWPFPSRHYTDPHSAKPAEVDQNRALRSGILRIQKSARFVRISGLWRLFQILAIAFLSASNWHAKWIGIFRPSITRSSQHPAGRSWFSLHASLQ